MSIDDDIRDYMLKLASEASIPLVDLGSVSGSRGDLQQPENVAIELQSGAKEPPAGDNQENSSTRKRERGLVSPNETDAKGKPPKRKNQSQGTTFTGESSTSGAPAKTAEEALSFSDRIKPLTVAESARILVNRINNRKKSVLAMQREFLRAHEGIKALWPLAAEVQEMMKSQKFMKDTGATEAEIQQNLEDMVALEAKIQKTIEDMDAKEAAIGTTKDVIRQIPKDRELSEAAAKQRLIEMENKDFKEHLKDLQEARKIKKEITEEGERIRGKTHQLQEFLLNNTLASGIPSKFTNQGSLSALVDSPTKFSNFKKQIFDQGNKEVGIQDFEGLEEALKITPWGETPDYLKSIAIEIETAIGKQINNPEIRVLFSAAIKEMKDFRVEEMEQDMSNMFKKWAATLNLAEENGFLVGFAFSKLEKILRAYFYYRED